MNGQESGKTQYAVQLVGPSELKLNKEKPIFDVGPTQMLARVEAVGLCFSDLKLLKQFQDHARKSEIVEGLPADVLNEIPSYVPGDKPTVPGHEVVVTIEKVGASVVRHKVGERCLVQTDYRFLPTAGSNAAFGYNFEGALQEYVLMDERVVVDPSGERYLIPVTEALGYSQVALVEPWACVEDSYVTEERNRIKAGGRLCVVIEPGRVIDGISESLTSPDALPKELYIVCAQEINTGLLKEYGFKKIQVLQDEHSVPDHFFDDIVYFGSNKARIETLNDKLAAKGIINIVLGGKKIGEPVSIGVGRIHYGMTRWIGTTGKNASDSYKSIPVTGEVRDNDKVVVIGAGGPMGQMHVIRNICVGKKGLHIIGTDFDDDRLNSLAEKAGALAKKNKVEFTLVNTKASKSPDNYTYLALMAPVSALVAEAIKSAGKNALINIFAGIPANVKDYIDLDSYIEKRCFMFGTSGSTIRDMKLVLKKVEDNTLDTDVSVDAISGMAGAIDGIAAVENRTLAGKIIVYPCLRDIGLIPLHDLKSHFPKVAAKLDQGKWCKSAENELLKDVK